MRHDPAAGQMLDVLAELYLHAFPQRLRLERLVQRARIGAAADEVPQRLRRSARVLATVGIEEDTFAKRRVIKRRVDAHRGQVVEHVAIGGPVLEALKVAMEAGPDLTPAFHDTRLGPAANRGQRRRESRQPAAGNGDRRRRHRFSALLCHVPRTFPPGNVRQGAKYSSAREIPRDCCSKSVDVFGANGESDHRRRRLRLCVARRGPIAGRADSIKKN